MEVTSVSLYKLLPCQLDMTMRFYKFFLSSDLCVEQL